jgi:transposase InsO family protein
MMRTVWLGMRCETVKQIEVQGDNARSAGCSASTSVLAGSLLAAATIDGEDWATSNIREVHIASRRTYGAPRVHEELLAQGVVCCRNTVAKLMHQAQIMPRAIRRLRVTTDSRMTKASPNLVGRVFEAQRPNACWLSDITYIRTREGWLYLAAILELYSRAVVGWSMDKTPASQLP